jgi:hypothetical protein
MRFNPSYPLILTLFLLEVPSALSQNLLMNPGFDRDLRGWTAATSTSPDPAPPGYVEASLGWTSSDAGASALSGGATLHARAGTMSIATASLTQCVPVSEGMLISFGAKFLTARQYMTAQAAATVSFFPSADCSGTPLGGATAPALPTVIAPTETTSGGLWVLTASRAVSSTGTRSVLFEIDAGAHGSMAYGLSYVDAVADDAFLTIANTSLTTTLLPSAAWVHGAAGSYWTTQFTLSNPGSTDAGVTFKWLGHDIDGRGGYETTYVVRAGQTFTPDEQTWWVNHPENWGAILVTSSSSALIVQSETRTYVPGGGTVGQALPAFGPADYAGATPKTLAPIRENALFRTNLVLANATEAPLMAHVVLYAADGTQLGSRDVPLQPLGMTQINRVAAALGVSTLDLGRIAVSTPKPGGLVAAYASIIDNKTNDPRTILPQDVPAASSGPNLLANPGFDRDLTGWNLALSDVAPNAARAGGWSNGDANGGSASGSAFLSASSAGFGGYGWVTLTQCVPVAASRVYGLRVNVRSSAWGFYGNVPSPGLSMSFHASGDCSGAEIARQSTALRPFNGTSSGEDWYTLATPAGTAPEAARSALVYLAAGASGSVHGAGLSAYFDDVSFAEGASTWTRLIPAAASVSGSGGSNWTTDLALSNAGAQTSSVYLEFLAREGPLSGVTNVGDGQSLSLRNVLVSMFGHDQVWGPLRVTATSPSVAVTAETSTPTAGGGAVGQAIVAFAPRDLIGAAAKSIAPVRDDDAFRTNLVVANATDSSLTAHVELFDAGGALVGSRDIAVGPLAATQINGVGWALAGTSVNPGRISVSTPTPGGLVAAYASVIDNATNDPRTILPR